MAHTSRCAEATTPQTQCRCSCGGELHGIAHHDDVTDAVEPHEEKEPEGRDDEE